MKNSKITLVLALFALLVSSCYPGGAEYYDELDLVYTAYDKDANFSAQKTYSRPDSVVIISSAEGNNGKRDFINQSTANLILGQLDANMAAYGYTKVAKNQNPNVDVLVSAAQNTSIYYYYSGWYYGWYGYYGGWYYPGYYPPTYSTVTTGGLLMQMVSPKDSTIDGRVPVLWLAALNGMLEGSTSSANSRIRKGIDQAFTQSSYLKR